MNYKKIQQILAGSLLGFSSFLNMTAEEVSKASKIEKIEWVSNGEKIVGNVFFPKDFQKTKKYKTVLVTGSWTTVKEQMPNFYATRLAEKGFVVMTFDFRGYGESAGKFRNVENPKNKSEDIANARIALDSIPYVDSKNIHAIAICASAGYLSDAIANGAKFKSVALVAPWLHNEELVEMVYGGKDGVKVLLEKSKLAEKNFKETNSIAYTLAASDTDSTAAMFGPFDYYLNKNRGAVPEWGNQFAVMAWKDWLQFRPIERANKNKIPTLIIHSKTAAIPAGAEEYYRNMKANKKFTWVEGASQFDFYDNEKTVNSSIQEIQKWFL